MSWTFDPWNLGADVRYEGLRLLLVGESHYESETDPAKIRSFTKDVVERWGVKTDEGRQRFFSNAFEAVTDRPWRAGASDVEAFWRNVYFYNYVQEFVGNTHEDRPTDAMFRRSDAAFMAVLRRLKPDAVLILGRTTWDRMIDGEQGPCLGDAAPLPVHRKTYVYDCGDGRDVLAAHTQHPSYRRFSTTMWPPLVRRFLDLSRERAACLRGV